MHTLNISLSTKVYALITLFGMMHSYSYSQNSSANSPYSIELTNGISLPQSGFKNYAGNGFNSGISIERKFCDKLSIGLGTRFTSLPLQSDEISNKTWNSTAVHVGPQYTIGNQKLTMGLYGRIGLSVLSVPEIKSFYANSDAISTNFENTKTTSFNTRIGVNIGLNVCEGLYFYANPEYASNLKGVNYGQRDLSKAVDPSGNIDPDLANEISFKNESLSFSSFNINFGIRFNFNSSNSTRATDYNSSRSNRTTSAIAPNPDNGNQGNSSNTRATDYNSSRSNRTTSAIAQNPDDGNQGDSSNTRATDYNSSRSNRSTSAIAQNPDDGNQGDSSNTRATDYNSSRSNRTTSAIAPNPDDSNGQKIEIKGRLLGVFISSRKFEFQKDNGATISGAINSNISNKELTKYTQRYLNKSCRIILKSNSNGGAKTYEMLNLKQP